MRYISNGEIEKLGISSNDMLEWGAYCPQRYL